MPRFERYPGPPSGGSDHRLYRVISPRRDALAWISIADRLRVTHYLVRHGDGWRDARTPDLAADTYNRPRPKARPGEPTGEKRSAPPAEPAGRAAERALCFSSSGLSRAPWREKRERAFVAGSV